MEKDLRQIMRRIYSEATYRNNCKIITVFLLTPNDDMGGSFTLDVISGIKKDPNRNNYTRIFFNESHPYSAESFKELLLEAFDRYKLETIIPDKWLSIKYYWWNSVESECELIDYAVEHNDWKCGKIGFRILQMF